MEEKLSVCIINDSFPPVIDGVANAVMNYAKIINEKYGKAVVAVPFYPDTDDSVFPYKVVRYPSISTGRLIDYRAGYPFSYETLEKIKGEKVDIIHAHSPFSSAFLARTLREPLDAPIVFTYHSKFDVDITKAVGNGYIREKVIKQLVRNIEACDEVWVVSKGAGENLRSLGYKGDYTVMSNGVDIPKGKVPEEEIEKVTGSYDLPKGVPVFLFVGRMTWYKGLGIILESLAKIKELGNDFRMVFIGGGKDREKAERYSAELGISENCVFTGLIRDRKVLRAWYSRADLFVFPSDYDTNGLVVREAAACGIGSVLIKESCAAEGIIDGETGFLCEKSADAFAEKLDSLCKNPEMMKTVGRNAMDKIYISWEDSVKKAAERYEIIIGNYRAGKYEREQTFADEWLSAEGEILDIMCRAKRKGKNIKKSIGKRRTKFKITAKEKRKKMKEAFLKKLGRFF